MVSLAGFEVTLIGRFSGDHRGQYRHVFNGVIDLPARDIPGGLELYLVPGHIAYVAVHTPVGRTEGYPIPLGILSFDPEAVGRVQASLSKILGASSPIQYHCDRGSTDLVSKVCAALQ